MNTSSLAALHKKREELASEIEALVKRVRGLTSDLAAIDVAIGQFDSNHSAELRIATRVKRDANRDWRPISRYVLDILQHAKAPLASGDVAERLPEIFGPKCPKLTQRVRQTLQVQRARGLAVAKRTSNGVLRWEIARAGD